MRSATPLFGCVQFRFFKHSIEPVKGDYAVPNDVGEVSHLLALAIALSGMAGLGNIAGVAVALAIGGPVIDFSDAAIFAMAVVNIIGLLFVAGADSALCLGRPGYPCGIAIHNSSCPSPTGIGPLPNVSCLLLPAVMRTR